MFPLLQFVTTLWAELSESTVKRSRLTGTKWRLGCYMRCPAGQWRIRWVVMTVEMDSAVRKNPNLQEKSNNSEETIWPNSDHTSAAHFIYGSVERGRFMVCYWSYWKTVLRGPGISTVWKSCVGSGGMSAVTIVQSLCLTGTFSVWLLWILLQGCQMVLPMFLLLTWLWLWKKISLIVQFKCGQNKLPWTGCVIQACRE